MPATYTHRAFTDDVYKVIPSEVKEKIDLDTFSIFGNSFDILFFSNSKLGSKAHRHCVNDYFLYIIEYIREHAYVRNPQVISYLYGSICHYVLDSVMHPYIIYKAGVYQKGNPSTYQYASMHGKYEYMIDAILYHERTGKKIYRAKLGNFLLPKIHFYQELNRTIDYAFLNTFQELTVSQDFQKGIKHFRFLLNHGIASRFGIKARLYRFLKFLHVPFFIDHAYCTYYIKKLDESVLNKEHKEWCYPADDTIRYHYSFYDLYDLAIERARELIEVIDVALDGTDEDVEVAKKMIGNNSYVTGLDCETTSVSKYFEH